MDLPIEKAAALAANGSSRTVREDLTRGCTLSRQRFEANARELLVDE
jgi:hypothetical protein